MSAQFRKVRKEKWEKPKNKKLPENTKRRKKQPHEIFSNPSAIQREYLIKRCLSSSCPFYHRVLSMSKKKRPREGRPRSTPAEQKVKRDDDDDDGVVLWRIVTDHPDIFNAHILPKLKVNGRKNDFKFFYDVNRESRAAIKRGTIFCLTRSKLKSLRRSRPYHGLSRGVLKRRNVFVRKWRRR